MSQSSSAGDMLGAEVRQLGRIIARHLGSSRYAETFHVVGTDDKILTSEHGEPNPPSQLAEIFGYHSRYVLYRLPAQKPSDNDDLIPCQRYEAALAARNRRVLAQCDTASFSVRAPRSSLASLSTPI